MEDMFNGNIPRSQLKFTDEIDNSSSPFIPKIIDKPNALVPLDPVIIQGASKGTPNLGPGGFYPHPYDYELRALQFMPGQLVPRSEVSRGNSIFKENIFDFSR